MALKMVEKTLTIVEEVSKYSKEIVHVRRLSLSYLLIDWERIVSLTYYLGRLSVDLIYYLYKPYVVICLQEL